MLCPASQSNTVMTFVHQLTRHLPLNVCPICLSHTCSRNAFGIFCLLYERATLLIAFVATTDAADAAEATLIVLDTLVFLR